MFGQNPFATLSDWIDPALMQGYIGLMVALVVGGTLLDMLHKRNAEYFFRHRQKAAASQRRKVAGGEKVLLAVEAVGEGLVSGEFCNPRRRLAHLLTMYGFLAYAAATAIMVFRYASPDAATPVIIPWLWHVGALMLCIGGAWFWFFIRVDVAAEGHSPFRFVHADLFVVVLLKSAALALIWSWLQWMHSPLAIWALGLYLIATTALFASVPWSKFSHMFYKPAAAFQRRLEEARGSRANLPPPADKPETFGSARELPQHY
ncbi:MAG: adenylyl-sulfate reductase [Alphaproteobacteria bacterium]|nr:adenylyl-sulfate reductase [Alphaproteobacteria bacterium]